MGNEWLQQLKPGDEVFEPSGLAGFKPATVDKVTATQIIIGPCRYRKADGGRVGASRYSWDEIRPLTDENAARSHLQSVVRSRLRDIENLAGDDVPSSALNEVAKALTAVAKMLKGKK